MSTLGEIEAALPQLNDQELRQLERSLRRLYRERNLQVLYDDAYGVYTDADLIASAEEAFLMYDREEDQHANRPPR